MRYHSSASLKAWNSVPRICIVIMFLFLSCVLFTACTVDCNGVDNCNGGTPPAGINPTSQSVQLQYRDLGTWTYWHKDGPYPQPPADGVIIAFGDIQNDGSCHIKIFYSGDTVANLGNGSFKLVQLITGGGSSAVLQYVKDHIQPPLQTANLSCPII